MNDIDKNTLIRDYIISIIKENINKKDKLPSENFISEKFQVSRHCVRKIYDSLEDLGLVYSKQGIGRFSKREKPEIHLDLNGTSFTKKMKDKNIPLKTVNLGVRELSIKEATKYKKNGLTGRLFQISRLRIIYDHPAAIHFSIVSIERFPNIDTEGNNILSIHEYYKEKGIDNYETTNSILTIEIPSIEDMKILKCGSLVPLLVLEGSIYDSHGVIEVIKTQYRSDLFKYSL